MAYLCQLTNKLRVVMEPMTGFRSVTAGVFVGVGSADETKGTNGLAHVIEHMLFKGTKKRTARQIADEMTEIGGNLDAYTTKEYTCFYTQTLKDHLPAAMDIISDMISNALLSPEDLTKELSVILEEIDMYDDDADELVHDLIQKEVWRNDPIGYIISGEKETVKNFDREAAAAFMNKYYRAENMVISIAGHFDIGETRTLLEEKFGSIRSGFSPEVKTAPQYYLSNVFRQKPIEQMHMNLAYPCIPYGHKDRYLFTIMNNIIGGNLNSRLFQHVREDKGLSYAIYSYGSAFKQCGLFQIDAAMNPEQTIQVLEAIKEVIGSLFEKAPITEHELHLAKEQIRTELIIDTESTHNHMESNGKALICGRKTVALEDILNAVASVTLEQLSTFMEKYLKAVRPSICLVGDLEQTDISRISAILDTFGKELEGI